MRNPNKLLVSLAVSTALYGSNVFAEDEEEIGLNVVTVTAQKRQESAQSIPISLSVMSAEQLESGSIEKLYDLQYKIPNLQTTETGISTQLYIRGIGTGNNQGFEQSVGQYIDGIYYGRQQLIRAPYLDLERVEVLRGPQSVLFGKNSIAGAISYTTAKPSDDLEMKFATQYIPEFGALELNAMISGGLSDNLSARLAVRSYTEDGYVENVNRKRDETGRDDFAVRGTLLWTPSDDIEITLKVERDTFDAKGRQIEIVRDDAFANPLALPGGPYNFNTTLGFLGVSNAILDADLNFSRQANDNNDEFSNNELDNITLTAGFDIGEYTLTSVTGVVSYEFTENCDCDFIALNVFDAFANEKYDQFSQEIRLVSPLDDTFDWVGGVFYQTNELDYTDDIIVPANSFLGGLGLGAILGTSAGREYDADSDLFAVFFQGNWHISDRWEMTIGGRYTSEEKTGSRILNAKDGNGVPLPAAGTFPDFTSPATFYLVAFGIETEQVGGHNLSGARDESSFTPLLSLQYKATKDVMFYGSYVTGFKAGGFDARANNTASFEFEEEEATSFEFGIKTTLFDNTLELNASVYRTDYDNLQVSQFDGVLGFNVGNAKETVIQGVEIDGRWWINEEFSMNYSFGFLDHEFKDFENGNCYSFQSTIDPDSFNSETGLCDYTGKSGQYTPSFTGNIGFEYAKQVNFLGFEYLTTNLGFYHSGSQNVDVNLNPLFEIDSYTKVDFRISLESEHFTIALFGKNVTDEEILTYVGNVPLSGSSFGTNTFYGFVDRPAAYGIQMSYEY